MLSKQHMTAVIVKEELAYKLNRVLMRFLKNNLGSRALENQLTFKTVFIERKSLPSAGRNR